MRNSIFGFRSTVENETNRDHEFRALGDLKDPEEIAYIKDHEPKREPEEKYDYEGRE